MCIEPTKKFSYGKVRGETANIDNWASVSEFACKGGVLASYWKKRRGETKKGKTKPGPPGGKVIPARRRNCLFRVEHRRGDLDDENGCGSASIPAVAKGQKERLGCLRGKTGEVVKQAPSPIHRRGTESWICKEHCPKKEEVVNCESKKLSGMKAVLQKWSVHW